MVGSRGENEAHEQCWVPHFSAGSLDQPGGAPIGERLPVSGKASCAETATATSASPMSIICL